MVIKYSSGKLQRTTESPSAIKRYYGTRAKLVNQRLQELTAAKNLETMRYLPKANCHLLSHNLSGYLAVDISANHRIIFKPLNPQYLDGGGLDWSSVSEVEIVSIGLDYH